MTKKPLVNALTALAYIVVVSWVMFYGTKNLPKEDSILAPISVLSLFTFSAAAMGYVFGYEPFRLYMEGKKKESVDLFLKTLGAFGAITAIILILLFSGLFR